LPPRRINEIVLGKRAITADTALRLAHYFGTSEQFWMALQASFASRKRALPSGLGSSNCSAPRLNRD
jgi:plasmid maintenance system antidote protein VapI